MLDQAVFGKRPYLRAAFKNPYNLSLLAGGLTASVLTLNPLLALATRLLEMAGGRATASEVLDLAALPAVRRRFGLDDDALARVERWVQDSGVRWGLDPAHRAEYGLGGVAQNTWRAGLDRVLLGVAMAGDEPRWVGSGR